MPDLLKWFLVGLVCGLVGAATYAHSQENNAGASYIGFCHKLWPCERSLAVFQDVPVKRLGFLAPPTFGRSCPCYRQFQKLPGPKYVRLTLSNGTCFESRGRKCLAGELFEGETIASADRKLRRRNPGLLRRYRRIAERARLILSGSSDTIERLALCLECPVSNPARRSLLAVAREVFPNGVFVDSVLTQRCLTGPDLLCEKHGLKPRLSPPCVGDTDGQDWISGDLATYRQRTAACEAAFLWSPRFNLLDPARLTFQPPRERTHAPGRWEFDNLRSVLAP
jgi:hypothetical protein